MTELLKRKSVDLLVEQFWRKGYLTLSRKFGTYLPEPDSVGGFDVDIIARQKNRYAIGVTLIEEELKDQNSLITKLKYLASRQTRAGNSPVLLFVGVKSDYLGQVRLIVDQLDEEIRKNIRLFQITDHQNLTTRRAERSAHPLFS
jgi:hypothetical protein